MKNSIRFFIHIIIFLFLLYSLEAAEITQPGSGSGDVVEAKTTINGEPATASELEEALRKRVENKLEGEEVTAYTSQPIKVTMPNGRVVYVSGNIIAGNGWLSAGILEYENSEMINAQNFETTDTGYTVEHADSLLQDGTVITGGSGIKFENGVLTAAHADSFITQGSVGTNSDNFEYTEGSYESFYVAKADSVLSGGLTISNIENSTFKIYANAVEVAVGGDSIDIEDGSYNSFVFKSNKGKVTVSKEIPTKFKIENGTLISRTNGITEKVETNNSAIIEIDPNFGFSCMKISPPGVYWYHENLIKDFGVHIPANSDEYKLCIRKHITQFFNDYDGIVDFPYQLIKLNKIVNYLRYPFKDDNLLSLVMDIVYQGKDRNNEMAMTLDDDFIFIDNFFIDNKNSSYGMVSYVNNGMYAVYEFNNGNEIKRYGRFNTEFKPNFIRRYNSFYDMQNPLIRFEDGILIQEGLNDFGTATTVKAVYNGLEKQKFENNMLERSKYYPIKEGRCGSWKENLK